MSWKQRIAVIFLALGMVATEAWAVVGRPLTPVSYAGVARRTARRSYGAPAYPGGAVVGAAAVGAVAVGATVAALPTGCAYSTSVYHCGGHVYRPVYQGPD